MKYLILLLLTFFIKVYLPMSANMVRLTPWNQLCPIDLHLRLDISGILACGRLRLIDLFGLWSWTRGPAMSHLVMSARWFIWNLNCRNLWRSCNWRPASAPEIYPIKIISAFSTPDGWDPEYANQLTHLPPAPTRTKSRSGTWVPSHWA